MIHLNPRPILGLLLGSALLGAGAYGMNRFMAGRNAGKLLAMAEHSEEKGLKPRAARVLERYLWYRPDDVDALARYGLLQADMARAPVPAQMAMLTLEKVLRADPGREEVRRRVARLALDLERYADVRTHATALLESRPEDGEAEWLLGRCDEAEEHFAEASSRYAKATERDPTRIDASLRRALLLRTRLDDPEGADAVMDGMVAANEQSAEARFRRALYRKAYGDPEAADADLARTLELTPDDPDVLLVAAEWARGRSDWDRARELLERALEKAPKDGRLYRALARVEAASDRLEQAEACLAAGVEQLPDDEELKWLLADTWIQRGTPERAEKAVVELRDMGYDKGRLGYLEGRLLIERQQWNQAAEALKAAAPLVAEAPDLARRVDLMLGRCYEQLGDMDGQYVVNRRRLDADPTGAEARLRVAGTLEDQGRYDEALEQCRRAVDKTPEVKLTLARLLIRKNLQLLPGRRRWEEADRALDEAGRVAPDSPWVAVLKAEALAARDRFDEARAVLEKARAASPKEVGPWAALAFLAARRGDVAAIPPLLDAAEEQLGDGVDVRLLRARYLAADSPDAAGRLAALGRDLEKFSDADRTRLIRGLAEAHARSGDDAGALALWGRVADARPNDLEAQTLAFDLATRAGDGPAEGRALARIRAIEGEDGPLASYAQARQLIRKVTRGDSKELGPARQLLIEAATRRPTWARVPLAQGEIAERQGQVDEAIAFYLKAVELGERDPVAIRRILQTLTENRRYEEVNTVLGRLEDRSLIAGEAQRLASQVSFGRQDYARALELADQIVAAGSKDYRDHVWLGQMRWAAGRRAEAEGPLVRAVALADDDLAPLVALVQYYVSTARKPKAAAAVDAAAKTPRRGGALLDLAHCYEILGQPAKAQAQYRQAMTSGPVDAASLQGLAAFLMRQGRPREAEPYLQKLIELKGPDAGRARRLLVIALATDGDEQRARRALEMLGLDGAGRVGPAGESPDSLDEMRTKARVLAVQRDEAHRRKAVELLTEIVRLDPRAGDDQLLLAQLHEALGDWPEADALMQRLLESDRENPLYAIRYIQALLRHDQADQAGPWLDRLAKLQPDRSSTYQVRALVLSARGRGAEAADMLRAYARAHDDQLDGNAGLLERIGQVAAAEELYRKYVERNRASEPRSVLVLAEFLGRQGRTREALDLCEPAWKTCPPEAVATACTDILFVRADAAQCRRVDAWLRSALERSPNSPELPLAVAIVRTVQGQFAEAEAIYRRVLERDPKSVVALNNLAWLLAHRRDRTDEALALIDRAIAALGPRAELLDTRAVVYMALGQGARAIRDLETGLGADPSAPLYFHLAQARHQAGQRDAARAALRDGDRLGLKPAVLDPLDRPDYDRLVAVLAKE